MIGKLIAWCVHNRGLMLLFTAFLIAVGIWASYRITVDAIPDPSDTQVIVRTDYPGQAPQIVQDQVTNALTTAMLSVPHTKVVRGQSMFGTSFVYVIFEDGIDMYWARSRVLEQLSTIAGQLPDGVDPQLGPDATGVGWVYQYVVTTGKYCPNPQHAKYGLWHDPIDDRWYASPEDAPSQRVRDRLVHQRIFASTRDVCPLDGRTLKSSTQDLSDLRSLQDWFLRYELVTLPGVSEVAPVGGFVKQYQVVVDPVKLLAYDLPLSKVKQAIQGSNRDAGGRVIERGEREYMVRSLGYLGQLTPAEIKAITEQGGSVDDARTQRVLQQLRMVSLGANEQGDPVYLEDVADIHVGPEIRRGIAEWNGKGEVVGGTIVMRHGENARDTIEAVRNKLATIEPNLPEGVAIQTAYDRSDLIDRAVNTLRHTLLEEIIVVSLVIVLFLLHARSALVAAFVLPTGVLATLGVMYLMGINANIMSLGGIALSIGVMVDSAIVMVENAHKHLEHEKHRVATGHPPRARAVVIAEAASEVGPTLFFSLLIITVSFLPIFVLNGQTGRLFRPLAYTKTFAMAAAAGLAVTIIPVLMVYLIRDRLLPRQWPSALRLTMYFLIIAGPAVLLSLVPLPRLAEYRWWLVGGWVIASALTVLPQRFISEERNPLSRILAAMYNPFFNFVMHYRGLTITAASLVVLWVVVWFSTLIFGHALKQRAPWLTAMVPHLGSELMPPLEEGDLLYMPTTDPGISITKSRELLQQTNKLIKQFPEVKTVYGKIGRSETATDPAPLSMIESTITLRRDKNHWRHVPVIYKHWPIGTRWLASTLFGDTRPITLDELVHGYNLPNPDSDQPIHVNGLDETVQIPGLTNAWTMPIKTRIDMLSTGIKTPVGIKLMGSDLDKLADLSQEISDVLRTDPRTRKYVASAYADKSVGGYYLYFDVNAARDEIAREGLTVDQVQNTIDSAIGGMNVGHTVEGVARYPINVRVSREASRQPSEIKTDLDCHPQGQSNTAWPTCAP